MTAMHVEIENERDGFQALMNPVEIYRLIQLASRHSARVDIYFVKSNLRLTSEVLEPELPGPGITLRTPRGFRPTPKDDECMAIVFLHGHQLLCLHSSHIMWQGDTFRVVPQWRAFTLQRRRQVRLVIPAGYEILVDLDAKDGRKRRVQRRVLDMSAGGMAFEAANREEAERYKKGQTVRHAALRVENRLVFVDARISQEATGSKFKVGVQFTRINQGDKDFLLGYVARHLVQLYG
jgi:hypothetical protein